MKPVPEQVRRLCDEFGVQIVPPNRYPEPGQTRAVETLARILRRYGEGHLRIVMSTLTETSNTKQLLDEVLFWSASDLVRACPEIVEHRTSEWLACWDAAPVSELQFVAQDLAGIVSQRYALDGMLYERVVRAFGPRATQPDLFDDRRRRA